MSNYELACRFLRRCRVWLSITKRDIAAGVTSGIPFCCIFYWLTLRRFGMWGFVDHPYLKGKRTPVKGVGYVQCERCYRSNRVVPIRYNTAWDRRYRA